jgi:hypothetical protein
MLNIVQQPASLSLSRNPIAYKLRALTIAGVNFRASGIGAAMIFGANYFDNGDTIAVKWTEPNGFSHTETFTFAVNSDTGPNLLPTNPYNTFGEYVAAIAAKLNKHPRINPFFTVTHGDDNPYFTLTFTALDTQDGWSISLTDSVFAFPINFGAVPAVASRKPINHKILYDVFFETAYKSGHFELIAQNESFVDFDGYCTFDIKDTLDAHFTASLSPQPIPEFTDTMPRLADNLRRFYVRIAERYGSPAAVHNAAYIGTPAQPSLVRLGGISDNLWLDNPDFVFQPDPQNRVLSWYPLEKTVTRFQPEWFAVTCFFSNETLKIKYQTVLVDGTMTTDFVPVAQTFGIGETVLLPVNIYALGSTMAENVVRYYVMILDQNDNQISATFTYNIDAMHHESQRYLMYLNGFGVPQTVSMTGVFSFNSDIDRQDANRAYAPNGSLAQSGSFSNRFLPIEVAFYAPMKWSL